MTTRIHTVAVPPLTDTEELISQYMGLFSGLGVIVNFPFNPTEGFTHPIEAENQKLTRQFFDTMSLVQGWILEGVQMSLLNTRVGNGTVVFTFNLIE